MTSSSSGGSGGGRKPNDPLVCHKLILNKVALSGEEDYETFDEWFIDMADDFEILIPGSKVLFREAKQKKEKFDMTSTLSRGDSAHVTNVSRELFSVLKKKTIGQARAQLKALSENEGLEAWRLIRTNLCRKDGQRLQNEFDTLTTLVPMKIAGLIELPTLSTRDGNPN